MKKDILEINGRTFDSQILQSDKPVLVDLWAPWCGPCNSIEPVVEKMAETYGDQIRFTRCNVDHNPKTPDKYGIKEKVDKVLVVYGGKFCYVNADKPTHTMSKIIEEQGGRCCKNPGYPLHGHDRRRS
jgi:thioredoxin 1